MQWQEIFVSTDGTQKNEIIAQKYPPKGRNTSFIT